MFKNKSFLSLLAAICLAGVASHVIAESTVTVYSEKDKGTVSVSKVTKSEDEWKSQLSPARFQCLRQKACETAYSGNFWNHHESGIYSCAACGNNLFSSTTKFESSVGMASFWQPIADMNIILRSDAAGLEVLCSRCESHLGYLYQDGPKPTNKRYSVNSMALQFENK